MGARRFLAAALLASQLPATAGLAQTPSVSSAIRTDSLDAIFARRGSVAGAVYRVTFPRNDMLVQLQGVRLLPSLALTSWAALTPMRGSAMMMGDLVLRDGESARVIATLLARGFDVTGVHNHLLHELPRVVYIHFGGMGNATTLARNLVEVLALTGTPATGTLGGSLPDTSTLQRILGRRGAIRDGVLAFGIPTSGSRARTATGDSIPLAMGMATAVNIQTAGRDRVVATGDFVLAPANVAAVQRALATNGIEITALHSHMLDETPHSLFMHFWAIGSTADVARGLRAALEADSAASIPR